MITILSTVFAALLVSPQASDKPVRSVLDPGAVTTHQTITPAGVQSVFNGRVHGVAFGQASSEIWVLTKGQNNRDSQILRLDWNGNRVIERSLMKESPGLLGLQFDRVGNRPLITGVLSGDGNQAQPRVRLLSVERNLLSSVADSPGNFVVGGPAVAAKPNSLGERLAVVPLTFNNRLAIIDVTKRVSIGSIDTGIAPFGAVIDAGGTVAYVSNWGGRVPKSDDLTLPQGYAAKADRVVVDSRGIAATGTVTRIDLVARKVTHSISVDLQPMAMAWDETRHRLYVANANKDTISVIDTQTNRVSATYPIQPFTRVTSGLAPTALALSPDGEVLYVACAGINAIAVIDSAKGDLRGLIPTGWYPNAISTSADGAYIAVGTLLGTGSGSAGEAKRRSVAAYRGSVHIVPVPDDAQLASFTQAVAENNHLSVGASRAAEAPRNLPPAAVPARSGEPSLIDHIVYIIKENRTYDQILGDMAKGNSDSSLVLFGNDVTPNQHRLADQFVLLDNFFATGGNSADGHQWVTQANETPYVLWPGYTGRSYPYDGTDPLAYSGAGFIWDAAQQMKKTVRVYGEFAGAGGPEDTAQRARLFSQWVNGDEFTGTWNTVAPLKPLNAILAKNYPPFSLSIPDVVRSRLFIHDLKDWEANGNMPNLIILGLPSNHTMGATPGANTPKAMVADNDLALGQIVDAVSHSSFWKTTAIFVVEDDAQDGVDHVDGHRTVAFAISPYTRRGYVDSTFYSQPSILKTIELMLGLPTLSLFDMIANDMRASFTNVPDFKPYDSVKPEQSLFEQNPQLRALKGDERRAAKDSAKMRFDVPDAAPTERLNRIVWHQVKGWQSPYPKVRQAVFAPLSTDTDDDDRD